MIWDSVPFSSLYAISSKNGVMAPARSRGTGVALINMREIFAYERISAPDMELAMLPEKNPEQWHVRAGDLLFARQSLVREGAGKCVLVLPADVERTFESHLIRVRLDAEIADSEFFFYYFASPLGRENMSTIIEQVAAAGIRSTDLGKLHVPLPPLSEQRAIAATLGALDNMIDSIMRANEISQRIAQALFKLWFIEQQPWDGATPTDWREGRLGDLLMRVNDPVKAGDTPGLPYVPIDMVPRRSLGLQGFRPYAEAQSSLLRFERNDILIGAMRVYFHRVAIAPFDGLTRTTCFVLRPRDEAYLNYVLMLCNEGGTIDFAASTSKGSTMPYAVWDGGLAEMPITIPPVRVAREFSELVNPIVERLRDGLFEIARLRDLRDALAPQLLAGNIRVREFTEELA